MEVRATLKPGQKGTQALQAQYGDRLVCVRYRYDKARGKRYKTAEIIVEEHDWAWQPRLPEWREALVRIERDERDLQARARAAGARWDPARKLWRLRPQDAVALGITERIVELIA